MKKKMIAVAVCLLTMVCVQTFAQPTPNISDTAKRPPLASPRDSIVGTLAKGGTMVTITYGSPGVKGRIIGKNLDPTEDSVWRAGANEATTFAVNKDVMVEGKKLPAGRYALFTIRHGDQWTLIFNKTWQTWGAYSYKENMSQDVLKVMVKQSKGDYYNERLKYVIDPDGMVYLMWGNFVVPFMVK